MELVCSGLPDLVAMLAMLAMGALFKLMLNKFEPAGRALVRSDDGHRPMFSEIVTLDMYFFETAGILVGLRSFTEFWDSKKELEIRNISRQFPGLRRPFALMALF